MPTSLVSAVITNGTSGTPSVVNLSGGGSVLDLTVGSFDTLNAAPGGVLDVSGSLIQNDGAINVTGGSGANAILNLDASVTLQGAGVLTMAYSGSGAGSAYIQQASGGLTLTNKSTIQGQGTIGNGALTVANDGTINASVSGATLLLNASGGVTNTGLLEATGGGTLNISALTVGNAGANITAGNGSTVLLSGSNVIGGTLNIIGTGTLEAVGSVGLDASSQGAMTINGAFLAGPASEVNVTGTLVNNGAMQVVGGSGSNTVLNLTGDTTVQGTGSVTLAYSGSGAGQAYIQQSLGGLTLTNKTTIQGQGVIGNGGLTVANDGTINANVSGATILLNASGGVTNSGLLEATGGGTLNLSSITVANAGENITAGSGSTVVLGNTKIVGGTLNNSGGTLEVANSVTLDASSQGAMTINGAFLAGAGTEVSLGGTLVNNGAMQLIGGNGSNTVLNLTGDTTLQGTGSVTLAYSGSGAGQTYIQQSLGGLTLTNKTTIQGQGVIGNGGLAVANDGTINANVSGTAILLNASGGVTNSGLLEATGGATLNLNSITVANAGENITAGSGSTVVLANTTIVGGTLNGSGGTLQVQNFAGLDGSTAGAFTINGDLLAGPNSETNVLGTIVNNGNMQITGGNGANTTLIPTVDTTLKGTGMITLGYSGTGSGQAYIEAISGGITLTNETTIQGLGVIGNGGIAVINGAGATIDANVTGGTLTVNPTGGFTNTGGLLEATNGGILTLSSAVVDNAGGTIKVDGASSVLNLVNGVTIEGGTLTSANGGSLGVPGSSITLDGSTLGALTLSTGTTFDAGVNTETNVLGTIVNNGDMQITGGNGFNTVLVPTANTTLQGTGTVTLAYSGSGAGQAYIEAVSGGITLTNEQTIQGQGVIGNSGLTVINAPGGTIDANVTGGTLTVNPTGGFTNTGGLLEATNGGILTLSSAVVDNAGGTIKVDGASSVLNLVNGVTIEGGTLTSANGGSLGVPGSSITLDGSTLGALTLSTGTTFSAGPNTQTNVLGTIVNNGNMQFTGGNGFNTVLDPTANTTLQGTGTVTLAYSGTGAGQTYLEALSGGVTLTNEQTIQGRGVIGNSGLAVINAPGGTIDANVTGGTLTVNPTGGLTNTGGLLEATNGGTLALSQSVIDNAGGTIKVDGATSVLSLVDGVTIEGGTLTSAHGGSLGVPGSSITLDGSTQGALTLSTGTTFSAGPNTQTNVLGTIVNNGNMQITGGNGFNAVLDPAADTTLQGTGTVTLAYSGSGGGQAYLEGLAGGITLTNKLTIQGQGGIGNGGLNFDNAVGGTVLANVSGGTLNFFSGGALTNEGKIQVNAGSTIADSFSSTTNSGTVAIAGGGAMMTVSGLYQQTGGSTVVAAGGTLDVQSLDVTGGLIQVDGMLDPLGPEHIEAGGTLAGTGLVVGDVTNDGKVILGDDVGHPGTLSETGNFTQNGDGVLDESITSLINGQLDVTGGISLDGTVNVDLLNGFTPANSQIFTLIDYTGLLGAENLSVTGSDASEWTVLYRPGQVDLEFNAQVVHGTPDGGDTWLLVGLGVAGLALASFFKRRWAY